MLESIFSFIGIGVVIGLIFIVIKPSKIEKRRVEALEHIADELNYIRNSKCM